MTESMGEIMARMDRQNAEFDAVERLAKCYGAITRTAVVDDDYPEVRHNYESALQQLLEASARNRTEQFARLAKIAASPASPA